MFNKFFIFIILNILIFELYSQNKSITAYRTFSKIKIDGELNENDWQYADSASNFIVFIPNFGDIPQQPTTVKVLYDNHSIYFGIYLYDSNPDSIFNHLTERDNDNGNADYFEISINPNNDGQNLYNFIISAANVQTDIRISDEKSDYNWNAVWYSAVKIADYAWFAEIEIPYSAIRFPKRNEHEWSVNFFRTIRRTREKSSWNPVDRSKGSNAIQMGKITSINNIDAPLRLSLMPYSSGYLNTYKNSVGYSFGYGMDLKWGISETYTLDMTLIPDFGQTKTDELILNLTPHETYYSENRPFFTEGTELFNKAGLFYSRRIGKKPYLYDSVNNLGSENNINIIQNPATVPLLNAFKISGRSSNNLALGFFNAITAKTIAIISDENNNIKNIITEPAANYNLIVVDKTFGLNNFLNFTNSNVFKPDLYYTANVSSLSFKIMDNNNKFGLSTATSYSYRNLGIAKIDDGYYIKFSAGKFNGNWIYYLSNENISEFYNINDMGYLTLFNQNNSSFTISFRKFSRFWNFIDSKNTLSINYCTLHDLNKFTKSEIKISNYATTIKYLSLWNNLSLQPIATNDYYEPRTPGKFYKRPAMFSDYFYISTDYRKKIALDFKIGYYADKELRHGIWTSISPLCRIGRKTGIRYTFSADYDLKGAGYFKKDGDYIIFSRRNVISFTNSLNFDFIISPKISISLKTRHYVSTVNNTEYYNLLNDGTLSKYQNQLPQTIYSFNIFNSDLLFSWNFLPGSFISIMWKNQIFKSGTIINETIPNYFDSFKSVWLEPTANNISLKFIYYLDYYSILKKYSQTSS